MFRVIVVLVAAAAISGCGAIKQKFGPAYEVMEVDELYQRGENTEVISVRKPFPSSCRVETVDELVKVTESRTVNGKTQTRESLKKFPLRKAICPTTTAVAGSNYGMGRAPLGMAASGVRMTTPNDVVITTPGNSDAVRGMREILGN